MVATSPQAAAAPAAAAARRRRRANRTDEPHVASPSPNPRMRKNNEKDDDVDDDNGENKTKIKTLTPTPTPTTTNQILRLLPVVVSSLFVVVGIPLLFIMLPLNNNKSDTSHAPVYCIPSSQRQNLQPIMNALNKAGWHFASSCTPSKNIDLIWSFQSPFQHHESNPHNLPSLVWHLNDDEKQFLPSGLPASRFTLVNHIPGSGYFTRKENLAKLSIDIPGIPPTFRMPDERDALLAHAKLNPDKNWIRKDLNHRGVSMLSSLTNKLDEYDSEEFLVQQLISPYLIGNKMFDIGLYVIVTSIRPLRAYALHDVLIRMCEDDYTTHDPNNEKSYVIASDYLPPWNNAELRKYYVRGHTTANVLLAHLTREDASTGERRLANTLFATLHGTAAAVLTHAQESMHAQMHAQARRFSKDGAPVHTERFFHMYRLDFVVDDQLNVHLLEVNQSPNMSPLHTPGLTPFFERLAYSLISILGLRDGGFNRHTSRGGSYACEITDDCHLRVPWNEVDVGFDVCHEPCRANCSAKRECLLCRPCRTARQANMIRTMVSEMRNREAFYHRIWPISSKERMKRQQHTTTTTTTTTLPPPLLSSIEDIHAQIFVDHMCRTAADKSWC
ncbi:tubulin-tyrosine ligase [Pycnococcus provasolii]|uniref:Tubulin-tyrosine ligase n=1 Tax=Pycnococcus provasolii TaxID=41880 RepID=A0A830HUD4_9CHLO|nr:tubulin-tyrosine ligase [Pycnococcus provasolii]